jgi:hypothetical protein
MQKRSRLTPDFYLVSATRDVAAIERLDRTFGLALAVAEGREVVLADEPLCSGVHGVSIEV